MAMSDSRVLQVLIKRLHSLWSFIFVIGFGLGRCAVGPHSEAAFFATGIERNPAGIPFPNGRWALACAGEFPLQDGLALTYLENHHIHFAAVIRRAAIG